MRVSKLLLSMPPLACAFVAGATAVAFVADANAAEPQQTSAGVIEEIVVTSRREEEQIQDVPVAVSAFTQQDITRLAPYTLADMDGLMPNVSIQQQTAGPSMGAIYIRGIGSADVEKTTPPQVGIVVDGIFMATNTGQLIDMFDVDQMEVNRGPQGVLYGKNTTGGTIVVRRSQPQFNEFSAKASVEGGTYNEQLYKGKVNIPLIDDTLALKLAGASSERDGIYRNQTRQTDDGNVDYKTYSAALKWQPVDEISATVWYDNIDDTGNWGIPNDPYVDGKTPHKTQANLKQPIKYNVDQWGLNLQWELGDGMTLESITGSVNSRDIVQQDFDNSTLATVAVPLPQLHTLRNQNFQQTSEELRLSGDLASNMTFTVGALYYDTSLNFRQGTNQVLQLPAGAGGFGLPPGVPVRGDTGLQREPDSGRWQCAVPGSTDGFVSTNESAGSVEGRVWCDQLATDRSIGVELRRSPHSTGHQLPRCVLRGSDPDGFDRSAEGGHQYDAVGAIPDQQHQRMEQDDLRRNGDVQPHRREHVVRAILAGIPQRWIQQPRQRSGVPVVRSRECGCVRDRQQERVLRSSRAVQPHRFLHDRAGSAVQLRVDDDRRTAGYEYDRQQCIGRYRYVWRRSAGRVADQRSVLDRCNLWLAGQRSRRVRDQQRARAVQCRRYRM